MQDDSKQEYGTLIAKKSERLVTALYLVTDLMDESEPIKRSLRLNSVRLLSSMNSLAQREVKDKVTEFKTSLRAVTEIISLLHVSITTGLVSDMNGSILMDGFRALQLVLEKKQPILTKDMLTVEDEATLSHEGQLSSAITSSSYDALTPLALARAADHQAEEKAKTPAHQHDKEAAQSHAVKGDTNKGHAFEKDKKEIKETKSIEYTQKSSSLTTSFQMKKQSRRDQILSLFVKGVDISIKDISSRIKGCSEKTIQRELNALLYDGLINRIGEKRWSRYILR